MTTQTWSTVSHKGCLNLSLQTQNAKAVRYGLVKLLTLFFSSFFIGRTFFNSV
jgi:hypothetical protein